MVPQAKEIFAEQCERCGSLIWDLTIHNNWHRQIGGWADPEPTDPEPEATGCGCGGNCKCGGHGQE